MDLLEELYLEDIEDYCNVIFDRENLPAGIVLAIHRKMSQNPSKYGVTSEKLSDMSITYSDAAILERDWTSSLAKYTRPHLVSNKNKKPYQDGR